IGAERPNERDEAPSVSHLSGTSVLGHRRTPTTGSFPFIWSEKAFIAVRTTRDILSTNQGSLGRLGRFRVRQAHHDERGDQTDEARQQRDQQGYLQGNVSRRRVDADDRVVNRWRLAG